MHCIGDSQNQCGGSMFSDSTMMKNCINHLLLEFRNRLLEGLYGQYYMDIRVDNFKCGVGKKQRSMNILVMQ